MTTKVAFVWLECACFTSSKWQKRSRRGQRDRDRQRVAISRMLSTLVNATPERAKEKEGLKSVCLCVCVSVLCARMCRSIIKRISLRDRQSVLPVCSSNVLFISADDFAVLAFIEGRDFFFGVEVKRSPLVVAIRIAAMSAHSCSWHSLVYPLPISVSEDI